MSLEDVLKSISIDKEKRKILSKYCKIDEQQDRNRLYEIIYLDLNNDELEDFLNQNYKKKDIIDFLSSSEQYNEFSRTVYREATSRIRTPRKGVGIYSCPKCKSKNTDTKQQQTRSSDEAMTDINECLNCNHRWRV
jgi:DNA-directed RNA polymerase subunit M/transcription elongation factor TFIIS